MGEMADDLIEQGYYDLYGPDYDDMDDGYYSRSRPKEYAPVTVYGHQKHNLFGSIQTAKALLWVHMDGTEEWYPFSKIANFGDHIIVDGWLINAKKLDPKTINLPGYERRAFEEIPIEAYDGDEPE